MVEFTLGAAPANPDGNKPNEPYYLFDPQNVDYDVSYVNSAFMPVAMEPFGNKLVGWVGTPDTIAAFNRGITSFLASDLAKGWPLFIGPDGAVVQGKVPSALEIFASSVVNDPSLPTDGQWVDPPKFKPNPKNSAPIKALMDRWKTCQNGDTAPICDAINATTKLLRRNYQNYTEKFRKNDETGWGCNQNKTPHPLAR